MGGSRGEGIEEVEGTQEEVHRDHLDTRSMAHTILMLMEVSCGLNRGDGGSPLLEKMESHSLGYAPKSNKTHYETQWNNMITKDQTA